MVRSIGRRNYWRWGLFGVVDVSRKFLDLEAGVGFGLTPSTDKLILKTILAHTF